MDHILTLVGDINAACAQKLQAELRGGVIKWLEPNYACDIPIPEADRAMVSPLLEGAAIDFVIQPQKYRQKRLLVCDMDSTMILEESIDLIAEAANCRDQVAAITEDAMAGRLDFAQAVEARAALFAGLEVSVFEDVIGKLHFRKGAITLGARLNNYGIACLLVSGGFSPIVQKIAKQCDFTATPSNQLEVVSDRLTGKLLPPLRGAEDKKRIMLEYAAEHQIDPALIVAVGDGANDVPMIEAAGLGICVGDKEILMRAADMQLKHTDFTALPFILGIDTTTPLCSPKSA